MAQDIRTRSPRPIPRRYARSQIKGQNMTALTGFFKDSESSLGVFYPKHYIIATFETFASTSEAALQLRKAGFHENDVLAIPGSEILDFFVEFRSHAGLWTGVMTVLSRSFGTEQVFMDNDIANARTGAGFLAVRSMEESDSAKIRALLVPFQPIAMHWYREYGVECMV